MKEIKIGILLSSATSSLKNVKDFLFNLDLNAIPRVDIGRRANIWRRCVFPRKIRKHDWKLKKEGEREGAFERCLRRI